LGEIVGGAVKSRSETVTVATPLALLHLVPEDSVVNLY